MPFSHMSETGEAQMVDVGAKPATWREAVAAGAVSFSEAGYQAIREGGSPKGDILGVARVAGIMAAKKVDALIPLTHSLALDRVGISFQFQDARQMVVIEATAASHGKTGVEMEALTAVAVAALTIYDMCKSADKEMVIGDIRLLKKTGGERGSYLRRGE